MDNIVNIVFITDKTYILPTKIALRSLIKHISDEYMYKIYVIFDGEEDISFQKLMGEDIPSNVTIEQIYPNINLNFISQEHLYVSKSALLKFELPNIFSYLDKILYIDGDVLIKGDLGELYEIDLEDYYLAAVKDMGTYDGDHLEKLGISDYFNSGVMLLNLKKIREDNKIPQLYEYKKHQTDTRFMDQDAFNVVLGQNVKYLSCKYNFIPTFLSDFSENQIASFYGVDKSELKSCYIYHLAGHEKPWNDPTVHLFSEWFAYLEYGMDMAICLENYFRKSIHQQYCDNQDRIADVIYCKSLIEQEKVQQQSDNNARMLDVDYLKELNKILNDREAALESKEATLETKLFEMSQHINETNNQIRYIHERRFGFRLKKLIKRVFGRK